ncbi:hypothetical protein GCM10027610_064350 [Dactylosporangium cerinum]
MGTHRRRGPPGRRPVRHDGRRRPRPSRDRRLAARHRLRRTGPRHRLPPLDGARFLRRSGWTDRISALVAHHSGACYVAEVRGLHHELAEFPRELSPVADALTYADQTVGPDGTRVDVRARMAEMLARHGANSDNARVHHLRAPDILAAAERVEHRLRGAEQFTTA